MNAPLLQAENLAVRVGVAETGRTLVRINPKFYRPAEVELLIGDPAKATAKLGWKPTTTYTVIKRLSERGVLVNENSVVRSLVSKEGRIERSSSTRQPARPMTMPQIASGPAAIGTDIGRW